MAGTAQADTLRIATFAAPLSRDGPGLLLRDLGRKDDQIDATVAVIAHAAPDILLLTNFDFDLELVTLNRFREVLAENGVGLDHVFALPTNAGLATGMDLDQDGRLGDARDAMGYGRFTGDGGLALLSRWPIDVNNVTDLTSQIWAERAWANLPPMADDVRKVQRLSSTGHWVVPVSTPGGPLTLMAYSATPPVFDGPEDRNGLRNRDELRMWSAALDGEFGPPPETFVVLGNANLDPNDGDGLREAMQSFLSDPRLQDSRPDSIGGALAASPGHLGDPALDTADWAETGPGNLRVSYVLPSANLRVVDAGVVWPDPASDPDLDEAVRAAGPHRLVWVDIAR